MSWSIHTLFTALKGYGLTKTSLTVHAICAWKPFQSCLLFFQISKPHEAVISKTVSVVDAAMVACDKIAYVQSGNLLTGIDNFSGSF